MRISPGSEGVRSSVWPFSSVGFRPVEPPEPPELVLVVFSEIGVVLVVFGSGGSRPADRPADFF